MANFVPVAHQQDMDTCCGCLHESALDGCVACLQVSLELWPNKDFLDKRTKFGIDVLPLEALLDYSEDDTKECHFEVSMFAEMFREMLQTRFARGLMRGLAVIEQQVGWSPLIRCLACDLWHLANMKHCPDSLEQQSLVPTCDMAACLCASSNSGHCQWASAISVLLFASIITQIMCLCFLTRPGVCEVRLRQSWKSKSSKRRKSWNNKKRGNLRPKGSRQRPLLKRLGQMHRYAAFHHISHM